jgi:hypothetical protein
VSALTRPRLLHRTPVVPSPRPAAHDEGVSAPVRRPAAPEQDRTSRRRRAALLLVALVAAVAAAVTTAVVQLSDDPQQLAPGSRLSGTTELDTIRDEMLQRRSLNADAERATDAQRDVVLSTP